VGDLIPSTALAVQPSADGSNDICVVDLWLSLKVSPHTRRAYAAEITRLIAAVRKPLGWLTLADVQAYAEYLRNRSLRVSSQNRALTAVKSLLAFGQEIGYLTLNVGAAVKLRPGRDTLAERILQESEIAQLVAAAAAGRDRVLIQLLYVSGVRVSEICGLKWRDAAPRREGGQITVFGKGRKTRTILLKSNVWLHLLSLRGAAAPDDAVFRSRKGGGHLDPSQVRRIVYAAARDAGLDRKVSPHWMRHAHASHALDHKAPIHLVQTTLGHASVSTTSRYLHARPTESSSVYLPDECLNPPVEDTRSSTVEENRPTTVEPADASTVNG
jgi:integrase/recombinase XerD